MKLEDLKRLAAHFPPTANTEQSKMLKERIRALGLDPDNLYQELEMSARFAQVHQDISFSNETPQLHSHTFYEILCCRNSCGAEYLVGAARYRLQQGDIIFVPPGVSHRPLLASHMDVPYVRDVLWLSEEFVQGLRQQFPEQSWQLQQHSSLLRTTGTRWTFLCDLLRSAVKEAERNTPDRDILIAGMAMTFMIHLKRAFLDQTTVPISAEKPDLLGRMLAYIEKNLRTEITLANIAEHFYVSESTVSQTFRKKMGVSFYRCVTQRRLITAKQLILSGYLLEQVAEETGFCDYSAFYRAFKQAYGISPRQYRNLQDTTAK